MLHLSLSHRRWTLILYYTNTLRLWCIRTAHSWKNSLNGKLTQNGLSLTFLAIDLNCHVLNAWLLAMKYTGSLRHITGEYYVLEQCFGLVKAYLLWCQSSLKWCTPFPGDIQSLHWERACSLTVSENLHDMLKCALRKSYQSQTRSLNSSKPSRCVSAAPSPSLRYSLTLLLSQECRHDVKTSRYLF